MADGAAPERTTLAWQRTALTVLAGALLVSRLTLDALGPAAFVVVVVAIPLALWVLVESRLRHRRGHPQGGRSAAVLTVAVVALALTELGALLRSW
ncbi:DUF202 domain-containing protein [Nocardioides caldifontis]|uniref:DUF202 domain-containing protein n=1 Tax=Nocardioides caldifontis TaxID=2588938 RepID=UPI0011E00AD6|nr:DUF202 domain-containing protein [Nocardioides caldifontis]